MKGSEALAKVLTDNENENVVIVSEMSFLKMAGIITAKAKLIDNEPRTFYVTTKKGNKVLSVECSGTYSDATKVNKVRAMLTIDDLKKLIANPTASLQLRSEEYDERKFSCRLEEILS